MKGGKEKAVCVTVCHVANLWLNAASKSQLLQNCFQIKVETRHNAVALYMLFPLCWTFLSSERRSPEDEKNLSAEDLDRWATSDHFCMTASFDPVLF